MLFLEGEGFTYLYLIEEDWSAIPASIKNTKFFMYWHSAVFNSISDRQYSRNI